VHIVFVALILATATFGHQVVEKAQEHETVTLIAPSLDSYALPVAKKIASGGGGGAITINCQPLKADCRSLQCSKLHRRRLFFAISIQSWRLSRRWSFLRKCAWLQIICRTWVILRRRHFLPLHLPMERAQVAALVQDRVAA